MGITKTLGGERLGAGKQMQVSLHNFGRSSHNIGNLFKTDQAAGTLVPYWCDIGLNGTTYNIELTTKVRTLPTNGPIFGRFKHQVDVFSAPIRLYIGALHNNALGIGMKMQNIKLPIMQLRCNQPDYTKTNLNSQQISQDSLVAYLGIRGLGRRTTGSGAITSRTFPATFMLMYWDVYKNYYANKQEEVGYVISASTMPWSELYVFDNNGDEQINVQAPEFKLVNGRYVIKQGWSVELVTNDTTINKTKNLINTKLLREENGSIIYQKILGLNWDIEEIAPNRIKARYKANTGDWILVGGPSGIKLLKWGNEALALNSFELSNIDDIREAILAAPKTAPFNLNTQKKMPYMASLANATVQEQDTNGNASYYTQAGLGIKTYLSDRFNNWLSTEWIDGEGGITDISSVDVSDGMLKMDALILAKKIYDMMNRIAVSGGSYNDWQEAVYGEKTTRMAESPMYMGGLSSEIVFDEVVSNSATESEPLGTLAGRGAERKVRGGRSIKIKVREPSMIMIIGSITPRVDYSQGNKWWNRLQTMNDFHKPNLDGIGFQELITDEMAAFDTEINTTNGQLTYHSAGKQTAWIEYQTNVDQSFGSFAAYEELSFMAMNRNYEHNPSTGRISDLTTYIDPTKYNVAFANTKLSAKNFWVQCAIDCIVRRKMSAKQMPNL